MKADLSRHSHVMLLAIGSSMRVNSRAASANRLFKASIIEYRRPAFILLLNVVHVG